MTETLNHILHQQQPLAVIAVVVGTLVLLVICLGVLRRRSAVRHSRTRYSGTLPTWGSVNRANMAHTHRRQKRLPGDYTLTPTQGEDRKDG